MKSFIKSAIKDRGIEPYARWLVKRTRGLRMPFDLVKDEIYDRQAFEIMQRVLAPESCCVDIGCHKGQFLEEYQRCAPRGTHYAFEPIPDMYRGLCERFPSARVYNYALSDSAGDTTFYVLPDAPALSGLNSRDSIRGELPRQKITVPTERLDNIIPVDVAVEYIKIDVEGAEGPVISGALETIRRNRPYIVLEHGEDSSLMFNVSSADIYDMLVDNCGLRISLLPDWLSGRPPLEKEQFCSQKGCWYFLAHPEA